MFAILAFIFYFFFILFLSTFFTPLPIDDAQPVRYRSLPWSTLVLMMVNCIVFLGWLAPDLYKVEEWTIYGLRDYITKVWTYGFRETVIREGEVGIGAFTTFTSMFMHADLWHLFGNMAYLWTFGRRIEDACGHTRFLVFYILAGMVANVGWALMDPSLVDLPGVGASGAIAGVMGAYLLLFPNGRITALWGIGSILRIPVAAVRSNKNNDIKVFRRTVVLPAWLLLIAFAVENAIPSIEVMLRGSDDTGGVNTIAHLAGFMAALTIFLFVRKDMLMRYFSGRSL